MYCNICGASKRIKYYFTFRQPLCTGCTKGMHKKLTRSAFEERYWQGQANKISNAIRRDFYRDYLASLGTTEEYIEATTHNRESFI